MSTNSTHLDAQSTIRKVLAHIVLYFSRPHPPTALLQELLNTQLALFGRIRTDVTRHAGRTVERGVAARHATRGSVQICHERGRRQQRVHRIEIRACRRRRGRVAEARETHRVARGSSGGGGQRGHVRRDDVGTLDRRQRVRRLQRRSGLVVATGGFGLRLDTICLYRKPLN